MNSDLTSTDTRVTLVCGRPVSVLSVMASIKFSVDCLDSSVSGFSALVKYLDSWQAVCVTTNKGPWVKLLTEPHFNRDTVEFASRERNESNPGIKTLLPFLKSITEESDLENFQDLIVALDACYWLHKAISRRFGDDRAI